MTRKKKQIAFVIYPGVRLLDLVGTLSIFMGVAMGSTYETVVVAEQSGAISSDTPMKLIPPKTLDEVPYPAAIVVLGGDVAAVKALKSDTLRSYVWAAGKDAEFVSSVGTGSLILASVGLLEGRQATTHWTYAGLLEKLGVHYVQKPWVEDGKFITAAGVSAGVDMALYMLAKLTGEGRARLMQLTAEYDPEPPLGNIRWDAVNQNGSVTNGLSPQVMADLEHALLDQPEITQKLFA